MFRTMGSSGAFKYSYARGTYFVISALSVGWLMTMQPVYNATSHEFNLTYRRAIEYAKVVS